MGGKDWTAEARRLLASATGSNDNRQRSNDASTVIFQAPVTVLNLTMESPHDAQRKTLLHRLEGVLAGEGEMVEEAFRGELKRAFGTELLADLNDGQLASLVSGINTMLRFARLLSGAP